MTWYYVPFISVADTAASSSPSEDTHEPWLTLSGTPTQRPLSWRGWQRRGWIKLLSGLTSPPSTVSRGVDEWISSLPVSLASPSPLPASGWGLTMTGGSGPTSNGSSVRYDPDTCSWKTCQALFEQDYPLSSMTLPNSGSMRNGVCSPRPTLAHPTAANGSGLWPGVTAMDAYGSGRPNPGADGYQRMTLTDRAVRMWGTPVARDDQKSPEAHMAMKARMDRNTPTSLTVQAKMWPTPAAHNSKGDGPSQVDRNTPGLPTLVKMWPTPCAREAKGKPGPNAQMDTLGSAVSRHDPMTTTGGPNGMVLNPQFVAALMGLPNGWDIAQPCGSPTDCTCSEMGSCLSALEPLGNCSTNEGAGNDE